MEEVKLTKEQEILFEVYDKGVQNEDCDLDAYVEKMRQALSIAYVSQQRELLLDFLSKVNGNLIAHPHLQMNTDFVDEYIKSNNCG